MRSKVPQFLAFREQEVGGNAPEDDAQAPSSCSMGNHGPGHCTGPFLSQLPLITTPHFWGTSSAMTMPTAVPSSSQGTGLTLLALSTLFQLLFLLFQVNQPPFLPSTHIPQPPSFSSQHPLPSLHRGSSSKPTQHASFLHHNRERFSL